MSGIFGYSEFVALFHVEDPQDLAPGLEVRGDGVYVKADYADVPGLHPNERAVLTAHSTGNLSEPTLRFPFSLAELEAFCDLHSMHSAMFPFDLARLATGEASHLETTSNRAARQFQYPEELQAAIDAFEAVRGDPTATLGKSPKRALSDWLLKNKSGLTKNAQKRIAVLANWQPNGGAPETPVEARISSE